MVTFTSKTRRVLNQAIHPTEAKIAMVLSLATIIVLALHLLSLTRYPIVFIDEPWYANASWNWLTKGVNADSMHAGTPNPGGYGWLYWPFLGNLPEVLLFAALGPGLFQARLAAWLFGIILVVATALVGRQNAGMGNGALAALLVALCTPFLQASHYARPDIMLAAILMAAYLLALIGLKEEKWWAHLAAGLLVGLSLDIHQNGMMFVLGLASMYIVAYRSRVLRSSGAWLCAAGGTLAILYYVIVHILPNPSLHFSTSNFFLGTTHQMPSQSLNPLDLLASLRGEIGRYHFYESNLDFALIGASLAYFIVRRNQSDRLLLAFVGASFTGFVLFVGNKHDIYAILFYPFLLLMVAETLVGFLRASKDWEPKRLFVTVLSVLFVVSSAIHMVRPIWQHRTYDYHSITEQIEQVIPPEARVVGAPEWWLGLTDYDYKSILSLGFYRAYQGYSLEQGMEALHPDILIMDTRLHSLLRSEAELSSGYAFDLFNLPRQEFVDFLAQRGLKLLEFNDPWHGNIAVYQILWD